VTSGTEPPPAPAAAPGGRSVAQRQQRLDHLAELLAEAPVNLVGRRDRPRLRDTHIPECLAVGDLLQPADGSRWLDLGTGGGLPGLVLAIQYPAVDWTLVDATRKKVDAVHSFISALDLSNARAVWGRAEDLAWEPEHRGAYDGVVSRAVARLPLLLEWCRGFLRDGGTLAAIKGPHVASEVREAELVRRRLALGVVHKQSVGAAVRPTTLVTMRAQGAPPRRYPRRPGVPAAALREGRPR
jgi:16S rRNA (guanine527-N7)-methyltransferase